MALPSESSDPPSTISFTYPDQLRHNTQIIDTKVSSSYVEGVAARSTGTASSIAGDPLASWLDNFLPGPHHHDEEETRFTAENQVVTTTFSEATSHSMTVSSTSHVGTISGHGSVSTLSSSKTGEVPILVPSMRLRLTFATR